MASSAERVCGLDEHGIHNVGQVYWNLPTSALYEQAVMRREGVVAHLGPFVVRTGHHTGRSPNDKFVVREPTSEEHIWWGKLNRPFTPEHFDVLYRRQLAYLQGKELFIQDCYAGADPRYRVPVRVITEAAWHNLFARTLFIRELDRDKLRSHTPEFTVIHTPRFHAVPELDQTNSEVFIIIHFGRRLVLIGGSSYAGEIKKSIFTIMNYLLPLKGVLGMHCSANYGTDTDDVALFFGLSGTGKTTLSASGDRTLIGDDEHGWSDNGVFNFEGGCYAKVIGITRETEPEIYQTTRMFGTILENVGIDAVTRRLDLDDASLTENTRGAYPVGYIPRADKGGMGGHPKNILFLTFDAFGVLPPVSRLTPEQARYHFLSGYTAKVASTEKGVTEPQATFSPCFGGPFLPLHPMRYADLLRDKIAQHKVDCWLINTGLTGGPYGVGKRFPLPATRAIVAAVLDGSLSNVATQPDPVFKLGVPKSVPGIDAKLLDPRSTWSDQAAYDQKAKELADRFEKNFEQYAETAASK
jgi:phosphoenolpyruvate carboxykinase (ATP)